MSTKIYLAKPEVQCLMWLGKPQWQVHLILNKYSTEACNCKEVYSNSLSWMTWKIKRKKTNPPKPGQVPIEQFQNQQQKSPTKWGVSSHQANEKIKQKRKKKKKIAPKMGASACWANDKQKTKTNPPHPKKKRGGGKCSLSNWECFSSPCLLAAWWHESHNGDAEVNNIVVIICQWCGDVALWQHMDGSGFQCGSGGTCSCSWWIKK